MSATSLTVQRWFAGSRWIGASSCHGDIEAWQRIEGLPEFIRRGEQGFKSCAALREATCEGVEQLDDDLASADYIPDAATAPVRVVVEPADLLDLLLGSTLRCRHMPGSVVPKRS